MIRSQNMQCDAGASGSLAEAMIFPMQYNGPTYNFESFPDELIFIPYGKMEIPHKPTLLFKKKKLNYLNGVSALLIHGNPKNNPTHFMVLFHGNGCDLGMASAIWRPLIRALPIHLLIVEFPGYGIMNGRCTCKSVIQVAEHVYKFVTKTKQNGGLGINPDKLIILGRSIGTGPASHLAKKKCHTLILVSPFTSIHKLTNEIMGKWTKWMLPCDYDAAKSPTTLNASSPIIINPHTSIVDNMNDNDDDDDNPTLLTTPTVNDDNNDNNNNNNNNNNIPSTQFTYDQKYNNNNDDSSGSSSTYDIMNDIIPSSLHKTKSLPISPTMSNNDIDDNKNNNVSKSKAIHAHIDIDDAYLNNLNYNNEQIKRQLQNQQNRKISKSTTYHSGMKKHKPKPKPNYNPKPLRKCRQPDFVFNNVTQIQYWQCKNVMIFHGKKDELIPYTHSKQIMAQIKEKRPYLNPKLHLIDGVGHNDVNIQFIGLRIFMEYSDELQPSFSDDESTTIDLNNIVPFLDDPPQFDITTNKVINFHHLKKKIASKKANKFKKGVKKVMVASGSSFIYDSDDDDNDNQYQIMNKFNPNTYTFDSYSRKLVSKVHDLHTKLKYDKSQQQIKGIKKIVSTKIL